MFQRQSACTILLRERKRGSLIKLDPPMSGSCGTKDYSMGHYAMPWAYSLLASDEHQRGNVRTDLKRDKKKLKSKPKGQDNELHRRLIEAK